MLTGSVAKTGIVSPMLATNNLRHSTSLGRMVCRILSEKPIKLSLNPITLTDYATLKKWECLDSDPGEALAEQVRKHHLPDFSNWQPPPPLPAPSPGWKKICALQLRS